MKLNLDGKSLKIIELKLQRCLMLKWQIIEAKEFGLEADLFGEFDDALMDLVNYVAEDGIDGTEKV